MKKARYNALTKDGERYAVIFEEHEHAMPNGNNKIVAITRNGERSTLDCRYIKGYEFTAFCEWYIAEYYGDNLKAYSLVPAVLINGKTASDEDLNAMWQDAKRIGRLFGKVHADGVIEFIVKQ